VNRTALHRTSALKRHKGVKPVSDKVKARRTERAVVREAVFERDGGCVLARLKSDHLCFGVRTVHHLKKASACGGYTLDNLVELCAWGNDWVECFPVEATALGLVRR
jgi:hypothetical protein